MSEVLVGAIGEAPPVWRDGKIITTVPIGAGTDGAVFNPSTMEAFSSQSDGTLTVIKENSPLAS